MRILPLLLLLALPAAWAQPPDVTQPFEAEYSVTVDGFTVGRMERSLRPQDSGFVLENVIYTTGLVSVFKDDRFVEQSFFKMVEGRPVPLDYTYRFTGGSKEVLERVQFDWEKRIAAQLRDATTKLTPIQPGMHDKLSYQLEMPYDLEAGKQQLLYPVAERQTIKDYKFNLLGEEVLETPFGPQRCLKVERERSNPKQAHTVFWVAVDMGYFLMRLRQDDDGHAFEGNLAQVQFGAGPAAAPKLRGVSVDPSFADP